MRIRLRHRRFSQLMVLGTFATAVGDFLRKVLAQRSPQSPIPAATTLESGTVDVVLRVNAKQHALKIEPRVTLLDVLREYIGLTGSKKGCDRAACGACTVLVEGRRINSCLTLTAMNVGKEITTIEGLAKGEQLHPVQAAFIKHDGFQCGYCTPGQIVSAVALLNEGHTGSDDEIREWMSGNICRCGAYPNIVAAIREVVQGGSNASV